MGRKKVKDSDIKTDVILNDDLETLNSKIENKTIDNLIEDPMVREKIEQKSLSSSSADSTRSCSIT